MTTLPSTDRTTTSRIPIVRQITTSEQQYTMFNLRNGLVLPLQEETFVVPKNCESVTVSSVPAGISIRLTASFDVTFVGEKSVREEYHGRDTCVSLIKNGIMYVLGLLEVSRISKSVSRSNPACSKTIRPATKVVWLQTSADGCMYWIRKKDNCQQRRHLQLQTRSSKTRQDNITHLYTATSIRHSSRPVPGRHRLPMVVPLPNRTPPESWHLLDFFAPTEIRLPRWYALVPDRQRGVVLLGDDEGSSWRLVAAPCYAMRSYAIRFR